MENILIKVKSKADKRLIMNLAQRLGFDSFAVSESEKRMLAKKKFVQLASNMPKIDISDEQINEVVESVRAKRYTNG